MRELRLTARGEFVISALMMIALAVLVVGGYAYGNYRTAQAAQSIVTE